LFASTTRQLALPFEKIAASQAYYAQQPVGSSISAAKSAASFLAEPEAVLPRPTIGEQITESQINLRRYDQD